VWIRQPHVWLVSCIWLSFYSRPRIASAIAEDCYILVVLFCFFPPQIFRHPWADFCETLPHHAMCSEIFYLLYGVHMCPLKNLRGEKPQFWRLSGPKSTLWAPRPAIPYCGKIGKSETIVSIYGYVSTSIPNMVGSSYPPLRSGPTKSRPEPSGHRPEPSGCLPGTVRTPSGSFVAMRCYVLTIYSRISFCITWSDIIFIIHVRLVHDKIEVLSK